MLIFLQQHEYFLLYDLLPSLEILSHASLSMLPPSLLPQDKELFEALPDLAQALHARILSLELPSSHSEPAQPEHAASKSQFELILKDLADPLLPIRIGALVDIRQLVVRRDPFVLKKLPQLLKLFRANLADDDNLMYLTAIRGLSTLGDVQPDLIVPALVADYASPLLPLHIRLKLGEALVQICHRLGQMLHIYAGAVVGAFLSMAVDQGEADLRASGLSNLGTMCLNMRYALHPWIQDIMETTFSRLACDDDLVVKRAGIFVFDQLLQGFHAEVMEFIPEYIPKIYTAMAALESSESDPVIIFHIRHAIATLESSLQSYLLPQQSDPIPSILKIV